MKKVRRIYLAGSFSLLSSIAGTSEAFSSVEKEVFNSKNFAWLCKGSEQIHPFTLAQTIISRANVPHDLLDQNGDGNVSKAEIKTAVLEPMPFGSLTDRPVALNAFQSLFVQLTAMDNFLSTEGTADGQYVVFKEDSPAGRDADLRTFIRSPSVAYVKCVAKGDPDNSSDGTPSTNGRTIAKSVSERLLIRETVEDLAKGRDKLDSLKSAELSFRDDELKEAQTVEIRGTVGWQISEPLVGYLNYQRTSTDSEEPDKEPDDIDVLTTGLLYSSAYIGRQVAIDWSITPAVTLDFEQDSEKLKVSGFADFAMPIGGLDLGYPNSVFGTRLRVTPTLQVISEVGHVLDAGTSELEDNEEYIGFGAKAGLSFRLPSVPILTHFTLSADYRYLETFRTIDEDIQMLSATLTYKFPFTKHMSLSLAYNEGENSESFQDEQLWKASLGIKY